MEKLYFGLVIAFALDVFLLADRITTEQYNELTGMMQKKE